MDCRRSRGGDDVAKSISASEPNSTSGNTVRMGGSSTAEALNRMVGTDPVSFGP